MSAKPLPPETSGPSQGNATELIPPKAAAPQSAVNPPVPPPARGKPSKSARKQPGASITTKPNPLPRQKQRLQNGFVPKRGRSQDRAGPTVATQNRPPPRFVPPPKFVPLQNGTAHSESGSSSGSDSEGTTTAINTGPSLKFNEVLSAIVYCTHSSMYMYMYVCMHIISFCSQTECLEKIMFAKIKQAICENVAVNKLATHVYVC